MLKSTLVEILRACTRKEQRDIRRWLQSPAHNQRKDVLLLFDYLVENLHADEARLEKETAWQAIFPDEPFDDAHMRQVMYFLLKCVEDCLAYDEMMHDEVRVQLALASVYRRRQLEKPFRLAIESVRKMQEKSPHRNSRFMRDQYLLEQEHYNYLSGLKRSIPLNLQETSDALDKAYIADKLHMTCLMLSHQKVFQKATYDTGLLGGTLSFIEQNGLLDMPAIAIYYYSYKTFVEPDDPTHFDNLARLIVEQGGSFPVSELREIYLLAINHCISRINAGKSSFYHQAFSLFKRGIESGILLENGLISRYTFGNAVQAAIRSKEFDWAEQFIAKHQHNLEERLRKNVVHFNLSRLYFEKGDYDKAQRLLNQFEYDDMLQNISAKTMLLKIYFEQGELDALEFLLESMRTYLQRKEALDPSRKASYKNLVSMMKKVLHLAPSSKTQTEKLRQLILETNPLAERDWLLRQLERKR